MLPRQICFKVCRVDFGLILMFRAFQEGYIRLLMTVIHIHRKKTLLYMLSTSVPVYIPSQMKKFTILMLKQHYDPHDIK